MLEKNTVVLDLTDYEQLKEMEREYTMLKENLNACQTKYDEGWFGI